MRRWVGAALGLLLLATSALVWWSAEQALGPAPEVHSSPRGGLTWCAIERPGQRTCDPPELAAGTVVTIVVLAVLGAGVLAALALSALRRRS